MDADELAAVGLRWDVDGVVGTLTLDRPEVRNAQTPAMWRAMAAVGESVPDRVLVVVVRGEGPSFSAGLDRRMLDPANAGAEEETVAGLLAGSDDDLVATIAEYQRAFTWLREPHFVSIAAVRGHAIGAGFQLALACDLRVLADDASLCMKEVALGLVPDLTGTKPLVEAVGYPRALELCATARAVDAQEADRIGLATTVVAGDDLDVTVAALAGALAAAVPGAVREAKGLLRGALDREPEEQHRLEREAQCRRLRELGRSRP